MNLGTYIRDTRAEMKHVTWPTQRQAFMYTILVIVVSIIVAALVGLFDFGFTTLLNRYIG